MSDQEKELQVEVIDLKEDETSSRPLEQILQRTKRERDLLEMSKADRDAIWTYAVTAVKGGFAGRHPNVESAYCAIVYGLEVGLTINQALQNVFVVNGRAALEVEAKAALVVSHRFFPPRTGIRNEEDQDNAVAWCEVQRDGIEYKREFSMREAREAGLLQKKGDVWKAYWRDMLRWRAMDRAIDEAFPDIVKGLASVEIMRDVREDVLAQDLREVDPDEIRKAMATKAKPRKKRKKEEVPPERREEPKSWEEVTPPETGEPGGPVLQGITPAGHLPGDEAEGEEAGEDVDELWLQWRQAIVGMSERRKSEIKQYVVGGGVFCKQIGASKLREAIEMAKAGRAK